MGALARLSLFTSPAFANDIAATFKDEYRTVLELASETVKAYTARDLEQTTYTEECHAGAASNRLWLRQWPITDVIEVLIWNGSDWVAITASHYAIKEGRYLLYPVLDKVTDATYGDWRSGLPDNDDAIKVTYTAGYSTAQWDNVGIRDNFGVPQDLQMAVCEIGHILWTEGKEGGARRGLSTISKGVESITADTILAKFPRRVQIILDRYRRLIA